MNDQALTTAPHRSWQARLWGASVMPLTYWLRGEPVLQRCRELQRTQWLSPDELLVLQTERLRSLIRDCKDSHPFYRDRLARLNPNFEARDLPAVLAQIPILERRDAQRLIGMAPSGWRRALRSTGRYTAGTTGVPLVLMVDAEANARTLAARLRAMSWFGIERGDREGRLWGRSAERTGKLNAALKDFALNRMRIIPRDIEPELMEQTLTEYHRRKPAYLYGYTSMIVRLAAALAERGLNDNLNLKAAIVTAEECKPRDAEWLSKTLGCPVANEYGCSEVDIIAHSCLAGGVHLMSDNLLIEVLPAEKPMPDGAGPLLITDLHNRMSPIIRYRLGDAVALDTKQCECGRGLPLVKRFIGRSEKQWVWCPDGRRVHSYIFDYFIDHIVGSGVDVRQARVAQLAIDRLCVDAIVGGDLEAARQVFERAVERELVPHLGSEIHIEITLNQRIVPIPGHKAEFFVALDQPDTHLTPAESTDAS